MNHTEAFWQFTLAIWADPALEQTALHLQDHHGLDPNLLLYLLWQQRQGRFTDAAGVATLASSLTHWLEEAIQPFRRARRAAKNVLPEADYRGMKALELELERHSQALLCDTLDDDAWQAKGDNLAALLSFLRLAPDTIVPHHWRTLSDHFRG